MIINKTRVHSSIDDAGVQRIILELDNQEIVLALSPEIAMELEAEIHWNLHGRPTSHRPFDILWETYGGE